MKAIIVGAGPVGCLLGVGLRRRGFDVVIYEKGDDPRFTPFPRGHSFNLTLSLRGLQALDPELRERQYAHGVRLWQRVIHHTDGTVAEQPYGIAPEHHLLSIPRRVLHANFVNEAARAGVRLRFRHECIRVDPRRTSATFATGSIIRGDTADLLAGCDGANSVVRTEMMQRAGARVAHEPMDHGYIELRMPPHADRALMPQGLHVWPRGDFMLIAQPNIDDSHTATLFLPFVSDGLERPSFEQLTSPDNVESFFQSNFPDAVAMLPNLRSEFHAAPPGSLRTVRCDPFHHHRTLLLGDAAHTVLPFYGQGINCSFDDVRAFLEILDGTDEVPSALQTFTGARRASSDALAELSRANFHELTVDTSDPRFHARACVERELCRQDPARFTPLYCMVAFSTLPYDSVVRKWRQQRQRLDALCEESDVDLSVERVLAAYTAESDPETPPETLELSANVSRDLLEATMSRILQHQEALAVGCFPASYVHDSIDVASYEEGKLVSAALREDEVPRTGTSIDVLLSEIFDRALLNGTIHPHPGFMAHVPSGGLLQGAVGDFIARAVNRFPGVWVAAPGLNQLECNVLRWFCTLLGYGPESFGYLTTSGSIANMMGLQCAVHRSRGDTIYVSEQGHFSIAKAARLIGITHTRIVPTRLDYTMDVSALKAQLDADRAQGLRPGCIVATGGTTNTGAIDDFPMLAALCKEEELWLHIDACFGGFFRMTNRGHAALRGIEEADSIAVDAHKSLFLPHGSSSLLVKDRASLFATFQTPNAAYLPGAPATPHLVDFCNYGPELSREGRGLTAWLPIKMHGIDAFAHTLDEKLDLALALAAGLEGIDGIEVVRRHPLNLPVVAFKLRAADNMNTRLCESICARGRVYLTTTTLPIEGLVLRACVLNHRTGPAQVDQLIADTRSAICSLR